MVSPNGRVDMTFDEARAAALKNFDERVAELRKIIADPSWCNELYKPFKESVEQIQSSIERLRRVNNCQSENTERQK